jgi:hypothetical protein
MTKAQLVGLTDIAERLNESRPDDADVITRQLVWYWAESKTLKFPKHEHKLGGGRLWSWPKVLKWATAHGHLESDGDGENDGSKQADGAAAG